ncbi:MAG: hypothetical protein ACD_52C00087G0007 [uncultured bacterium]|uniref:Uncharacterized protein n=1 Tax=Candidatus Woesebacteria bacterium RIFCSPHIGHO2_12_FULL_41_24 TaxID=1802510 RepID=A0A1F8AUB4_9BACT|nr:MAG: hypothetical protein ACD_52C00087G0007 [uncultured bacterium]OGM14229.1 MAG: hypothetical protein A2W15_04135 [Candidatus Woesebacteria bacterium RBG_16_41_13]OGM29107.1 MAG: hypothetical protein A2873_00030 [Candidatus Woesebacteria bacterium RIFCSPHIGHO2_01_FULL_42_80]OGM35690.1 MAG: hypothetical protein A3D84_03980 [Candidatus Woesebacteria bacterium RIFCSPHIGHO2_02_FULL_42_20]OGM55301.1 MAG: hypothetical protein A3E44_03390 [Candidatus Woesebacteria bacterium RIFCSPHIGHO2_12_FULL_41
MSNRDKILDIAMNLNRIGNWSADGFSERQKRINTFLYQTSVLINSLNTSKFTNQFKKTFDNFVDSYRLLEKQARSRNVSGLDWGERAMTWGNILTHRAKFVTN